MATKTKSAKRILRVKIIREVDTSPETSFLGEYHSDYREGAIDRQDRGDCGCNEYRYFSPAMTGEQTGNPDSPEQDYQRMEALNRGEWCFYGIEATADVILAGDTVQRIRSGGLWGIESDSDESYFAEVEAEELANLRKQLRAVGFSDRQVSAAFQNAEKNDA